MSLPHINNGIVEETKHVTDRTDIWPGFTNRLKLGKDIDMPTALG